ncbi:hypothetical protein Tco_0927219 [Tanacetum coccineum]
MQGDTPFHMKYENEIRNEKPEFDQKKVNAVCHKMMKMFKGKGVEIVMMWLVLQNLIEILKKPIKVKFSDGTSKWVIKVGEDQVLSEMIIVEEDGVALTFSNGCETVKDKRHVTLSRSGAEIEYCGVANVVAEIAWLRNLLLELHAPLSTATIIDIHFVPEIMVARLDPVQVRVLHVPPESVYLDILGSYKRPNTLDFVRFLTYVGVCFQEDVFSFKKFNCFVESTQVPSQVRYDDLILPTNSEPVVNNFVPSSDITIPNTTPIPPINTTTPTLIRSNRSSLITLTPKHKCAESSDTKIQQLYPLFLNQDFENLSGDYVASL